jgi:hypothetical protein
MALGRQGGTMPLCAPALEKEAGPGELWASLSRHGEGLSAIAVGGSRAIAATREPSLPGRQAAGRTFATGSATGRPFAAGGVAALVATRPYVA